MLNNIISSSSSSDVNNFVYMEHTDTTAQLLLIKDSNIVRNCFVTFCIITAWAIGYGVLGVLVMRTQFGVFWKNTQ